MSDAPTTQDIRTAALDLLAQYGAPPDDSLVETIMIRDGHYIGRRFSRGDLSALWLAASNTIRIVDSANHEAACLPLPAVEPASLALPAIGPDQRAA